jgi:methylated-DNA-protein-cysteine methyltransferase-like protein
MDPFERKILEVVRSIPAGSVMSYGQIALYTGNADLAREVGEAMGALGKSPDFPWWRVLNNAGKISIDNPEATPEMQRELLAKEGVEFVAPLELDMNRYRFAAEDGYLRALGLDDAAVKIALEKYGPKSATQSLGL